MEAKSASVSMPGVDGCQRVWTSPGSDVSPFMREFGLMGGGEGLWVGARTLCGIDIGGGDRWPRGDGATGCLKEFELSLCPCLRGDCTGVVGPDRGVLSGESRELMSMSPVSKISNKYDTWRSPTSESRLEIIVH